MYPRYSLFLAIFGVLLLLLGLWNYVRVRRKLRYATSAKSNNDNNRLVVSVARRSLASIAVIAISSWMVAAIVYFQRNAISVTLLNTIVLVILIGSGACMYVFFTQYQNRIVKRRQLDGGALTEKDM